MTAIATLIKRELSAYFFTPLGWLVMTLFLLVQGYGFYLLVELLNQPRAPRGPVMRLFFGGTFYYWLFTIVVVAALTMRLLAEERRRRSIELLLTAPVSELQLVLAKYLAALGFFALLWLPTAAYVVLLFFITGGVGVDLGPVVCGYVGTMLLGGSCIAIGVFCSAATKHQLAAAVATVASLTLLLLLSPLQLFSAYPWLKRLLGHISLFDHMADFSRGIIDSRHLCFHASLIVVSLVAATKLIERRKWA